MPTKRVRRIVSTRWLCDVCGISCRSEKSAEKCEARPLEVQPFRIGDYAIWRESKMCDCSKRAFVPHGEIVDIIGPHRPDYEYEVKWLGGDRKRLASHVFEYELSYRCPRCGDRKRQRFYAPELKRTKRLPLRRAKKK